MDSKKIFSLTSYLRFPFYLFGIYFFVLFLIDVYHGNNGWKQLNSFLILIGIGLAFSSLKDPARKTNVFSEKIYKSPFISTLLIAFLSVLIGSFILIGLSILFFSNTSRSETIGVGMVVLGIGLIGYLKYMTERIEFLK